MLISIPTGPNCLVDREARSLGPSNLRRAVVLGRVALQRMGGQTGDVLGASSQVCECLALIVLVVA